jgi:hypothetical protein
MFRLATRPEDSVGEWKKTSMIWQPSSQPLVWGMGEDLKEMAAFFPATGLGNGR